MTVLSKTDLAAKAARTPSTPRALCDELLRDAARDLTAAGVGNVQPEDLQVEKWGVLTLSCTFTLNGSPRVRYLKEARLFGMSAAAFTLPVREGGAVLGRKQLLQRLAQ